jgi:hypothetical protein
LRFDYWLKSHKLKGDYHKFVLTPEHVAAAHKRTAYLNTARDKMIAGRDYLDAVKKPEVKLGLNPARGENYRFFRTDMGVNLGAGISVVFAGYGMYMTGENLVEAANGGYLNKQVEVEKGKWAGSILGMRAGANIVMRTPIRNNALTSVITVGVTGAIGSTVGESGVNIMERYSSYAKYLDYGNPFMYGISKYNEAVFQYLSFYQEHIVY